MAESHREEIAKLESLYAGNPGGRVFVHLAEALRKAGEFERARNILDEGLARHQDSASGYVVLGRLLTDLQEDDGAVHAFGRVLELDSGNLIALRALADLALRGGRRGEALDRYRDLLARNPTAEDVRHIVVQLEAQAASAPAEPRVEARTERAEAEATETDPDDRGGEPIASPAPWEDAASHESQAAAEAMPVDGEPAEADESPAGATAEWTAEPLTPADQGEWTAEPAVPADEGEWTAEPSAPAQTPWWGEAAGGEQASTEAESFGSGPDEPADAADAEPRDSAAFGQDAISPYSAAPGDAGKGVAPEPEFGVIDTESFESAVDGIGSLESDETLELEETLESEDADPVSGTWGLDAELAVVEPVDADAVVNLSAESMEAPLFEVIEPGSEDQWTDFDLLESDGWTEEQVDDEYRGSLDLVGEAAERDHVDDSFIAFGATGEQAAEPEFAGDEGARDVGDVGLTADAGDDADDEHGGEAPFGPADGLLTETMADLYSRQGFHDRAAEVYRGLLRQRPGDEGLLLRLAEAEQAQRAAAGAAVPDDGADAGDEGGDAWLQGSGAAWANAAASVDAPGPDPATPYAWSGSGDDGDDPGPSAPSTPAIGAYLRDLLAWQPAVASGGATAAEEEPSAAAAEEEPSAAAGQAESDAAALDSDDGEQELWYGGGSAAEDLAQIAEAAAYDADEPWSASGEGAANREPADVEAAADEAERELEPWAWSADEEPAAESGEAAQEAPWSPATARPADEPAPPPAAEPTSGWSAPARPVDDVEAAFNEWYLGGDAAGETGSPGPAEQHDDGDQEAVGAADAQPGFAGGESGADAEARGYGAEAAPQTSTADGAEEDDEDLAMFRSWLQSLKK